VSARGIESISFAFVPFNPLMVGLPSFPAPTAAPTSPTNRKIGGTRLRLRRDEVEKRLEHRGGLLNGGDVVLGPFEARNDYDVEALRKEIMLHGDSSSKGVGASNAKAWLKRRQQQDVTFPGSSHLGERQTAAEQECYVGNDQLSCYPTSGLEVDQGTWSKVSLFDLW
jgi:hypothetical protein